MCLFVFEFVCCVFGNLNLFRSSEELEMETFPYRFGGSTRVYALRHLKTICVPYMVDACMQRVETWPKLM